MTDPRGSNKFAAALYDTGGAAFNAMHPDFGATGDGTTDDTDAVQACAAAAAAAGNGTMVLPSVNKVGGGAIYVVSDTISANNISIVGGGMRFPILQLADGANCDLIAVPTGNQGVNLRHLRLEGNSANQSGSSSGLVFVGDSSYVDGRHHIEDVFIDDFLTNGVRQEYNHSSMGFVNVQVRSCGAESWYMAGTDTRYWFCTSNDGTKGWYLTGGFHELTNCESYEASLYNFHLGTAGWSTLTACNADSAGRDNYQIEASTGHRLIGCISRDPSQETDNTYTHIHVNGAVVGTAIECTFKAKSKTNRAAYLVRYESTQTDSVMGPFAWDTNAASSGILVGGALANVLDLRPTGSGGLTANSATPSVNGSFLFTRPVQFYTQNTGTTTVTNFTNGLAGQTLIIRCADAYTTIQHNGYINLAGGTDFAMNSGDILTLNTHNGTSWYETARRTA
jgi:hypothetical protein